MSGTEHHNTGVRTAGTPVDHLDPHSRTSTPTRSSAGRSVAHVRVMTATATSLSIHQLVVMSANGTGVDPSCTRAFGAIDISAVAASNRHSCGPCPAVADRKFATHVSTGAQSPHRVRSTIWDR